MLAKRVIARLDIKPPNLVKGIMLEGLRVMGNPNDFARRYYTHGVDELIFMDVDASLDGRCSLEDLVRRTSEGVFVPLTVGGGIRTVDDMRRMLKSGADKVAINTAAIARPELISEAARQFGSQAIVVAIEYAGDKCFTDCGREHTGRTVLSWAREAEHLGAGEIMLTSIARDGTKRGYDLETIEKVATMVKIPVIAHGGAGKPEHLGEAASAGADGLVVATVLHYGTFTVADLKGGLHAHVVRPI